MLGLNAAFWTSHIAEGLSYMVMIMLMAPCIATMAVIKKEGGWKNLWINLGSSFAIAYIVAIPIYWISFACSHFI
jgi:Fe2+ transport system protein B